MSNRGRPPCVSYNDCGSLSHYYVQCLMNIFNRTEECPTTLARRPSATFYPRSLPLHSLLTGPSPLRQLLLACASKP